MPPPEHADASNPQVVPPESIEATGKIIPWTTIIASLVAILFYAGIVVFMYYWTGFMDDTAPEHRDKVNKLAELKAGEEAILRTSLLDKDTQLFAQIPIDRAMEVVAANGTTKLPFGKLPPEPKKAAEPKKEGPVAKEEQAPDKGSNTPKKEVPAKQPETGPTPKTGDAPKQDAGKK